MPVVLQPVPLSLPDMGFERAGGPHSEDVTEVAMCYMYVRYQTRHNGIREKRKSLNLSFRRENPKSRLTKRIGVHVDVSHIRSSSSGRTERITKVLSVEC